MSLSCRHKAGRHTIADSGFSLAGLLLALSLTASAGLFLFRDAHHFIRQYIKLSEESSVIRHEIRIRRMITAAVADLDASPLPLMPIIHEKASIRFADGTANPVTFGGNAPHPDSNAVTIISPDSACSLRVLSVDTSSSGFRYFACAQYRRPDAQSPPASFIGVSVDGLMYMAGGAAPIPARPGCFLADLNQSRNMALPPAEFDAQTLRLLVPISREYTIYVSKNGDLRILGHRGAMNIENQPIMSGIGNILFTRTNEVAASGIFGLEVEAVFLHGQRLTFAAAAALGRARPFNMLAG